MIIRLAAGPFSGSFFKLFFLMLPLVISFAMPIATCLAVGITVGNLVSFDEILLLQFFDRAKRTLGRAVLLFTICLGVIYIPLVFEWGPRSYWWGKQFLLTEMRQEIENLPAQQFHAIASRCTIFFQKKAIGKDHDLHFESLLLMLKEKEGKQYIVTAQEGRFSEGILSLQKGVIYSHNAKLPPEHYVLQFKTLQININQLFFSSGDDDSHRPVKFLLFSHLYVHAKENIAAYKEWHKRWIQIVWQFLLPFFMFFLMLRFARQKSNILLCIAFSGMLFLVSYVGANMASVYVERTWWTISIWYTMPLILLCGLYLIFRRK